MNLVALTLSFIISCIGIAEVHYLISKRIQSEKPVCPIGGDCHLVLESSYNKIFPIVRNDVLGFGFYIVTAIISAALAITEDPEFTNILIFIYGIMLAAATIMSVIFFVLQWRVIKAWCFWCLLSALTVIILDIILIIDIR